MVRRRDLAAGIKRSTRPKPFASPPSSSHLRSTPMSSKKKATLKPLWTSSVKLVKPPYQSLVGPQMSIHSGWWTAGFGEADESVGELSLCQVLEVD